VITYRATLDVPRELVWFVARLLLAERRRRGTPEGSRELTCFWQAVLGLRWFRDRTMPDALARDHGISRATACRYLEEIIAVLADEAPELHEALERANDEGFSHVILDGLPTLADPGYEGAGLGILIPVKQPPCGGELDIDTRTRNAILRSLRCLGEHGFALLTGRWRTLQHITASPSKIGDIARAALILTHFEHGFIA
jgi:DDE superfamily endonuclease